jgi:hypothetical protein
MTTWKSLFRFIATITSHALTTRAIWIACLCFFPAFIFSQTDEIQVYDGEIAAPGILNLMIHNNFTPKGRTVPDYPGAIIANHSYQVTGEWAYGVKPWMEQGLYMPVTSLYSTNHGTTFNGFKIRELFVRPNAHDHTFFYAANFEFSFNQSYWEPTKHSAEIRPIVGLHLHPWDVIYNPIVDTDWKGGAGNLQYNPAGRVAYNVNDSWAIAAEEYDGFGPLNGFVPLKDQFHEVWATTNYYGKRFFGINIESGIGYGLTAGSDKWTVKWMLSRDLNTRPWRP